MNQIIPIFFSCDDNYIPYLAVTIKSIMENKKTDSIYNMYVLSTSMKQENIEIIKKFETRTTKIEFIDVQDKIDEIEKKLDDVRDYYTKAIFYRIFIASLFPNLKKAIYLDCDIVVVEDIEKFFSIELGDNIFGAIVDDIVQSNDILKDYVENAVGIPHDTYFNSGVLLMNLESYRKNNIEERFIDLIKKHHFPSVAPDQDYLNYLCSGKIKYIDKSWDLMPVDENYTGPINLIHYNMFTKPWLYDVKYDDYFWHYAKKTIFYKMLLDKKALYKLEDKQKDEACAKRMVEQSIAIVNSQNTFKKVLKKEL